MRVSLLYTFDMRPLYTSNANADTLIPLIPEILHKSLQEFEDDLLSVFPSSVEIIELSTLLVLYSHQLNSYQLTHG